ncbi:MAG: response regulator [Candidatus Omnitrophica bacterium]|nr:response regulator [Candidatus Omnitrophota bacterium]
MEKKILVVDDDEGFLDELSEALSMRGFQIIEVDDPCAALEVAEKTNPDLILLDLKMPQKSGVQLAYELKSIKEFSRIPVVAMSGFFKDKYSDLLTSCGIKACFKKPFNIDAVIKKISNILDQDTACRQVQ